MPTDNLQAKAHRAALAARQGAQVPQDAVMVPRSAVEWLQRHKPALCEKAGLKLSASPQAPAQPEQETGPSAREIIEQLVTCHEEPACPAVAMARRAIAAPAAQAEEQEPLTEAARDVLAERRRQVEAEGWTPEHDDEHDLGELAAAASAYALAAADEQHPLSQGDGNFNDEPPPSWPWAQAWWKVGTPRRMLEKAGALVPATIEQIDRHAERGITKEQP